MGGKHRLAKLLGGWINEEDPHSRMRPSRTRFISRFDGTRLNKHRWSKYDDPEGKFSGWRRTKASVKVRHGSLEIIGHYQKPYGYVGGGVSYNFNRTYGRWVVRFRADRGAGYEPVVLLWPKG